MDDEQLTGDIGEFLSMTGNAPEPAPDETVPAPDETATAAADRDSADEDEDVDLSPEERVAAVLGEDVDDGEDETPEDTDEDEDETTDPAAIDFDALTPEQKRELAEELQRLRSETSQTNVESEDREVHEAVFAAEQQARRYIDAAWQSEVLDASRAHYGKLIREATKDLERAAHQQTQLDPETFIERNQHHLDAHIDQILRAKDVWENEQRLTWQPRGTNRSPSELIEATRAQAMKQHPVTRQRYAEWLVADRKIPQSLIPKILEEPDTDRMHVIADHEREKLQVAHAERRRSNTQRREDAAATFSKQRTTTPSTGKPKPAKVVPLRGDIGEWLEARKRGVV